jgi:hypothetical protein
MDFQQDFPGLPGLQTLDCCLLFAVFSTEQQMPLFKKALKLVFKIQ